MRTTMKISDALIEARALLTPEVWHKGGYFAAKGDTVCMCAHGATQSIINDRVAKALKTANTENPASALGSAALTTAATRSEEADEGGDARGGACGKVRGSVFVCGY